MDGLCDAIGTFVFWLAITWKYTIQRHTKNKSNNHPDIHYRPITDTSINILKNRLLKYYILFLVLIITSSLFWNISIIQYNQLLDPDLRAGQNYRTPVQEYLFKSSITMIIMWFWRCFNPHALTNYLLISIWINKCNQFILFSCKYFFFIIFFLIASCTMHINHLKNIIK